MDLSYYGSYVKEQNYQSGVVYFLKKKRYTVANWLLRFYGFRPISFLPSTWSYLFDEDKFVKTGKMSHFNTFACKVIRRSEKCHNKQIFAYQREMIVHIFALIISDERTVLRPIWFLSSANVIIFTLLQYL